MPSAVRSYSKINLGLAIGTPRPDGFHSLTTLYQTLSLHDILTISARPARRTTIRLSASDPRVPRDARNTAWKMVTRVLEHLKLTASVTIRIEKNLPIQGGMGAGSANAAAALLGLERELRLELRPEIRLKLAAEVGSDVPLFLVGGSVLGTDRGQIVSAVRDVTLDGSAEIPCVIALPDTGVSTPQAFRDWDELKSGGGDSSPDLHNPRSCDTLEKLSRIYASVFPREASSQGFGASGIFPEPSQAVRPGSPEKPHGLSREQLHIVPIKNTSDFEENLAENSLLALVRTGIENDFETVVFPQYPLLRDIKRHLMGSHENAAVYSALSGSGSALFGLYRSHADAQSAQQRLQQHGVQAIVTSTLPRPLYWSNMFAE
jgi:4-diphosphocytidyl-2-C-methyl-D-erythritol kinase